MTQTFISYGPETDIELTTNIVVGTELDGRRTYAVTDLALDAVRAKIFGELITLAMPGMKAYTSDLYYDAGWLKTNLKVVPQDHDGFVFYFTHTETGTSIGIKDRVSAPASGGERRYRFSVWLDTAQQLPRLVLSIAPLVSP